MPCFVPQLLRKKSRQRVSGRRARTADAPKRSEEVAAKTGDPIARVSAPRRFEGEKEESLNHIEEVWSNSTIVSVHPRSA